MENFEIVPIKLERLLTVREVAAILNCSAKQMYRYVSQGFLDECIVRIGDLQTIRFHPRKLQQCIEQGRVGSNIP